MAAPTARRLILLLAALTVLVLTAAAGVALAPAAHAAGAQNRVGAFIPGTQSLTRPAALESSCTRPGLIASTAGIAAGFCVAAEDADHIVLGLRAYGTQDLADQIGGRTLLDDPEWQDSLRSGIADSGTRFSVNLDGLSGDSPYSKVMNGVQGGLRGEGATNWELLQLYQSGRLGGADLYSGGGAVENPFG